MHSIVVLQARTSSSRLPAKVLLPLAGMPIAVLSALRAANTGREVVAATSCRSDDDELATLLRKHGIRVHRGSLDNVLQRLVDAAAGHPDDTVFVRLTADNVFPDGALIDEIVADFLARGVGHLACNGEHSGLPYGVSCEVTRLGHLREAARADLSAADQEHVTPYVIRKFGAAWFDKYRATGRGHFRCTIDNYDDYVNVQRVFSGLEDPVRAPLSELIRRLDQGLYQPLSAEPATGLVVGGAQLGMHYGIANSRGMPHREQSAFILKTAIANGAAWVDTARAYGSSEAVVGEVLEGGWAARARVVTKLALLDDIPADADKALVEARVDASVFESCTRLRVQRLDTLLLHRASHLHLWEGAAWKRLVQLRDEGVIHALGVSVQGPMEAELALRVPEVTLLQLPYNLLDWRWDGLKEVIAARKRKQPLLVHLRSVLLQGLLCSRAEAHWLRAHVPNPRPVWAWMESEGAKYGCTDVADLCLRFARSQPWCDGLVLGMETAEQVEANIRYFATPLLDGSALEELERTRPRLPEQTLNPARWLKE